MDRLLEIMCVWLDERSSHTVKYYRRDLLRFDTWLRARGLSVLAPPKLEDIVFYVNQVPRTPVMKEQSKLVLRSFFNFCFEDGYLPVNPARRLRLTLPPHVFAERIPTPEMIRLVCRAAATRSESTPFVRRRDHMICEFAFMTGARLMEITSARVDCIQRNVRGIQIQLSGKRKRTRCVLLPAEFAGRLIRWVNFHGADCLFPTVYGVPLTYRGVFSVIKRAARIAGYPNFSTHWFRHGHASESIENGCPLNVVQATLGHTNVATTSRYLHARPTTSSALYLSLDIRPVEKTFVATERKPANEGPEQSATDRQPGRGARPEAHHFR